MYEKIQVTQTYLIFWIILMIVGTVSLVWGTFLFLGDFGSDTHTGYSILLLFGTFTISVLLLDVFAHAYRVIYLFHNDQT